MIHIVMDIFEIMLSMFDYLLYVIIIMLIYGIKMVRKMPIILTDLIGRCSISPHFNFTLASRLSFAAFRPSPTRLNRQNTHMLVLFLHRVLWGLSRISPLLARNEQEHEHEEQ
jgi:hypothetical protein